MTDDHDRFADAAGAYVLYALADDEVVAYEAHLAGCGRCREEVARLQVAADALPASPEQYAPPPELKLRIMAVVESEAELLQAAGARADRPPRRRDRAAVLRRGWWSLRPGLAVAATVAVLAVGVAGGIILGGGSGTRTVVASTAPAGARVELIQREGSHSTLVARRLPTPGRDRVYQVWLKSGKAAPKPTNALFGVRPDGSASVDVPGSLKGVDAVLVTSEPAGGSQAPTRDPILSIVPA